MLKVGDKVEWINSGVIIFSGKVITGISPCETYIFVEGSQTGLPIEEIRLVPEENEPYLVEGILTPDYPIEIRLQEANCSSLSHYLLIAKACFYQDKIAVEKLLKTQNVEAQKQVLIRPITAQSQEKWENIFAEMVYEGCKLKCLQNSIDLVSLTGKKEIIYNDNTPLGNNNLLGKILMKLRDSIYQENIGDNQ